MPNILNHNNINLSQIKNMMNYINFAQNPQIAMQQLIQYNPQIKQITDMCRNNNPKDVFYNMCKERNIDPNSILNQLR